MSRRVRTILTLEVRIPQPAGYTQKQLLVFLQDVLKTGNHAFRSAETQVRIAGRQVTYL